MHSLRAQRRRSYYVVIHLLPVPTSHSLIAAKSDLEFRDALASATAVVVATEWMSAAWLSGCSVGPRITGFDYFFAVVRLLFNTSGGRAFLLDLVMRRWQNCWLSQLPDFPSES
jgi:hypothetical protein